MTSRHRAGAVTLAAVLTLPAFLLAQAPSASAAPAPSAACLTGTGQVAPVARRAADTTPVTRADRSAVPSTASSTMPSAGVARLIEAGSLPAHVKIAVYVHVIKGTHRGERVPTGPKRVKRLIQVLNDGFHGKQSPGSPATRYSFQLKHIDYTKRDGWYHAYLFGPRDTRAKKKLHRGDQRALNLYIGGGGTRRQPILGWSRFPWQYHYSKRLDSVSVNVAAMPGGRARHYNLGDTVIHETGHWMGLLHTFQGGCKPPGDLVADTPAEASPSYFCNTTADTCPDDPGTDPVHDFMDYSYDTCMNTFTAGQVARMDYAFAKYRR